MSSWRAGARKPHTCFRELSAIDAVCFRLRLPFLNVGLGRAARHGISYPAVPFLVFELWHRSSLLRQVQHPRRPDLITSSSYPQNSRRKPSYPTMAILSCLPGLKVNVKVGGELAKEYDAPAEDVEARSKSFEYHRIPARVGEGTPYSLSYIESKPGQRFEFVIDTRDIELYQSGKFYKVIVTLTVDGYKASPDFVRHGALFTYSECLTGDYDTGFLRTSFKFAALDIGKVILYELCPAVADQVTQCSGSASAREGHQEADRRGQQVWNTPYQA